MGTEILAKANSSKLNHIPDYLFERYPKFIEFITAYFEWSSTQGGDIAIESMKLNGNIDSVIESLLEEYKNSFAPDFPKQLATEYRHFGKFLKEFYQTKGTEESFRQFFLAAYGEGVLLSLPSSEMLEPSNADFKKTIALYCVSSDVLYDVCGLTLNGKVSGTSAIVDTVKRIGALWVLTIYDLSGEFGVDEVCSIGGFDLTITPCHKITSIVSGAGWYDKQIVNSGNSYRIDKVAYSPITGVSIANGGLGYSVNDKITAIPDRIGAGFDAVVDTVNGSGTIQTIKIIRGGFGFSAGATLNIESAGTGASITATFNPNHTKATHITIIHNKPHTDINPSYSVNIGNSTTVTLTKSATFEVSGWVSLTDCPSSDTCRLIDSDTYHQHSYRISSNANFKKDMAAIRSLLHIAGYKMVIVDSIDSSTTLAIAAS